MAVFEYTARNKEREESLESGTILADSESEALVKLRGLGLDEIRVKKVKGFSGIFKKFTADIK